MEFCLRVGLSMPSKRAGFIPPMAQAHVIPVQRNAECVPFFARRNGLRVCPLCPRQTVAGISLAFLAGTVLATLATGEHYIVDLIPGLAFGCFAGSIGVSQIPECAPLSRGRHSPWSLAIRFEYAFLIAHSFLVKTFAVLTVALAIQAVFKEWGEAPMRAVHDTSGLPNKGVAYLSCWDSLPDRDRIGDLCHANGNALPAAAQST